MDGELKIVIGIITAILFLSNTGVGIWIYRIMKASEKVDKDLPEQKMMIVDLEKKAAFEREERLKMTYSLKQIEKESTSLHSKSDKMFEDFIQTTNKFQSIATELNATMKHLNSHISGIQSDIREIRGQVQK
jgi:predicted  nucleic acid-binding Zn-ribbon protein